MLAVISWTYLGHNTNSEMFLKAQLLVLLSGLTKDMREEWKVEGDVSISVPVETSV